MTSVSFFTATQMKRKKREVAVIRTTDRCLDTRLIGFEAAPN